MKLSLKPHQAEIIKTWINELITDKKQAEETPEIRRELFELEDIYQKLVRGLEEVRK